MTDNVHDPHVHIGYSEMETQHDATSMDDHPFVEKFTSSRYGSQTSQSISPLIPGLQRQSIPVTCSHSATLTSHEGSVDERPVTAEEQCSNIATKPQLATPVSRHSEDLRSKQGSVEQKAAAPVMESPPTTPVYHPPATTPAFPHNIDPISPEVFQVTNVERRSTSPMKTPPAMPVSPQVVESLIPEVQLVSNVEQSSSPVTESADVPSTSMGIVDSVLPEDEVTLNPLSNAKSHVIPQQAQGKVPGSSINRYISSACF